MHALLPALAIVFMAGEARAARVECPATELVSYMMAPRCVGETRRVVGRVERVTKSARGTVFLDFCTDWRTCPFSAIVFPSRVEAVGDLASLAGREVYVTGAITHYRGHPRVILDAANQVAPAPEGTLASMINRTAPALPPSYRADAPAKGEFVPHPIVSRLDEAPSDGPKRSGYFLPADEAPAKPNPAPHAPERAPSKPAAKPAAPAPATPAKPLTDGLVRASVADGPRLVGRNARLRGQVARLDFVGNDLVAIFKQGGGEARFVAVVTELDLARLQTDAEKWDTRTIEVTGDVAMYDGRPAIYVRKPAQVQIVEMKAARSP